jgi:hypothetical protein
MAKQATEKASGTRRLPLLLSLLHLPNLPSPLIQRSCSPRGSALRAKSLNLLPATGADIEMVQTRSSMRFTLETLQGLSVWG